METETQVSASKFENTNHVILSQIVKNDMFLKIKQQGINCHYIPMIMVLLVQTVPGSTAAHSYTVFWFLSLLSISSF